MTNQPTIAAIITKHRENAISADNGRTGLYSMYCSYYNFTCKPFDLVPNPEFIYLSRTHKRAITYLEYGIKERAGFVLLTGEVGSGKTTIIRELIDKNLKQGVLAKVINTNANSEQLLAM